MIFYQKNHKKIATNNKYFFIFVKILNYNMVYWLIIDCNDIQTKKV
jgi:hypothetical protein